MNTGTKGIAETKCYFCGETTNGESFVGNGLNGNAKSYPVCNDCNGPDLQKEGNHERQ